MGNFKEINIESFVLNPFKKIGTDWMLITAKNQNKINSMTASWGGLGVMWGKNVSYVVIRPQRYTKEFVDNSETFSLCFFSNAYKDILKYMGTVSGRDEDKIENSNLNLSSYNDTPFFDEAKLVLICKKLYKQDLKPDYFLDNDLDKIWYANKDYHCMYISEIKNVLVNQ